MPADRSDIMFIMFQGKNLVKHGSRTYFEPDERQKITQYLAKGVRPSDTVKLLNRNIKTVKKGHTKHQLWKKTMCI